MHGCKEKFKLSCSSCSSKLRENFFMIYFLKFYNFLPEFLFLDGIAHQHSTAEDAD